MAAAQSREEVAARLEAIFSSAMEGEELAKSLASIEKRLDKFEGKWGGLIKWAEQKYGKPEDAQQKTQEEAPRAEQEPEPSGQAEMSREEAFTKLESIFRSNIEGDELDKMIGSIDKRLDKFQGKWPKLILWAEEKYGKAGTELEDPAAENPENTQEKHGVEQTLELIIGGDHESALKNLKQMISEDPSDSDTWNAFSSYFSSIGLSGRAKACEEKAESLT
ncbi:MAG: hypothetical protein QGF32_02285 [Candidatus Thalassarchaeaceae archaeon]|jgi:tetratricopeptide (TPR) repeat protein|nr:hypothetical protein [Candidatus Thalassarchaeaceae archaeon]